MAACWRFRIDGCSDEDERLLVVDLALGHAARGRSTRMALRLRQLATDPKRPRGRLARVTASLRAALSMEELIGAGTSPIEIAPFVERFATLRAISCVRPMRVRTSVAEGATEAPLAHFVAYVLCDLIHMAERMPTRPDLMLAVSFVQGDLVLGLAVRGVGDHPIPDREGMAALQRARRLTGLLGGGLERGMRDGSMIVGVTVPVASGAVRGG